MERKVIKMGKRNEEAAREWAEALCKCAGMDAEFLEEFWRELINSEGVYSEFVYYLTNRDFLCEYKIEGCSVVDIMVWQLDHFKARMDRGEYDMRENGDKMLLMAFNTMLRMEKEPEKYVRLMLSETGTDYPEKF